MFSNFFFSENRAVYEMMCRAQNALLHFHCNNGHANLLRTLPFFSCDIPVVFNIQRDKRYGKSKHNCNI
jgi:hypothetical protein